MIALSSRNQILVGFVLAALLVATRGHHFVTVQQMLPSASWAVFFLAGVYLRPVWVPAALLGLAAFLDYAAISWGGVSDFCVSPAYIALIPAYGAMWAAGRWYAGRYAFKAATLLPLAASAFAGTFVCELISSGSFYVLSGRFVNPTLVEFAGRFVKYFPHGVQSVAFWVAVAAAVHAAVVLARQSTIKPTQA